MTRYEMILEFLEDMNTGDAVVLHNDYCDAVNYVDDRYYSMYEFDDLFCGCSPLDIVDKIGNDFNSCDDYFYFDGYGYAKSVSYPEIDFEEIAQYIDDNDDPLWNSDIQHIIDTFEDDDDGDDE